MVGRDRTQWADDLSLYHRLRDSVKALARGAGTWSDRAKYLFERLSPIKKADFPPEYHDLFETIKAFHEGSIAPGLYQPVVSPGWMSPRNRIKLTDAIFTLYEEMTIERARQGKYD